MAGCGSMGGGVGRSGEEGEWIRWWTVSTGSGEE
jgi:hypothetical protein